MGATKLTTLLLCASSYLSFVSCLLPVTEPGATPKRIVLKYQVAEELPIDTLVGNVLADSKLLKLPKAPDAGTLQYDIFSAAHRDLFRVDADTGLLRTRRVLDREDICIKKPLCVVQFDVNVAGSEQFFQIVRVEVTILDVNDNYPAFHAPKITVNVSESSAVGSTIVLPTAYDSDSESFGLIRYEYYIANGSDVTLQTVSTDEDGASDIRLVVTRALDRETKSSYKMLITAFDGGFPSKSGTMEVTILVQDVNDNVPVFENSVYNLTVNEDFPLDTVLVRVKAFDADEGDNARIYYGLSRTTATAYGGIFAVDNVTGVVSLRSRLDFQKEQEYVLSVAASDMGQGAHPVYAKVIVNVRDVNDNPPAIRAKTKLEVAENEPPGTFVSHVTVDDEDSGPGGQVVCTVVPSTEFNLVPLPLAPMAFKIITAIAFDREQRDEYHFAVSCHDLGEPMMTSSVDLTVRVTDSNDNAPVFERDVYSVTVHENNSVSAIILRVTATDVDLGENSTVRYALDADSARWLNVDGVTGIITAAGVFDFEEMSEHEFHVIATDGGRSQPRLYNL